MTPREADTLYSMGIHWQELVIVLLIVLLLFGPKRLPEIGRSLGNGIREFRESFSGSGSTRIEQREAASVPVEVEAVEETVTSPRGV